MIRASDDNGTRTTPMGMDVLGLIRSRSAAAFGAIRKSLQTVEEAHATRCSLMSFATEEFQDTGVDPSDATGIASWQPDLPFFMQNGFGQR